MRGLVFAVLPILISAACTRVPADGPDPILVSSQEVDRDTSWKKGKVLYRNALSVQERVDGWVMEGPGETEFKDGWMHLYSPGKQWTRPSRRVSGKSM